MAAYAKGNEDVHFFLKYVKNMLSQKILSVAVILLLITVVGESLFVWQQLQAVKLEQDALFREVTNYQTRQTVLDSLGSRGRQDLSTKLDQDRRINAIAEKLGTINQFISGQIDEVHTLANEMRAMNAGQKQSIDTALREVEEVKTFKSASDSQLRELNLTVKRLGYSMGVLTDQMQPSPARHPKQATFSYYESGEWKQKVDDHIRQMATMLMNPRQTIDAKSGTDTLSDDSATSIVLDGIYLRSIEIYDLFNGRPNKIRILAPGLTSLENNALEIRADKDLDAVSLDGCLKWKKGPKSASGTVWKAVDGTGDYRTVTISNGVATTVETTCNDNYFLDEDVAILRDIWHAPDFLHVSGSSLLSPQHHIESNPVPRMPLPFGLAGIGIKFHETDDGSLFVQEVIPGTPAEQAGIKKGDRIVDIDGQPVKGMNMRDAGDRIRGPEGTEVVLTCRPYASPAHQRTFKLKRTMIHLQNNAPI